MTASAVTIGGPPGFAGESEVGASLSPFAACTLNQSGGKPTGTERSTCVTVQANLSNAPAIGGQATMEFTVTAAVAVSGVRISAELSPHLRWVTRPAGTAGSTRTSRAPHLNGLLDIASTTRSMAAGERLRFSGVVRAVKAGPAEIQVQANGGLPGGISAGADAVFLTVAKAGGTSRFGISTNPNGRTARYTGPKPVPPMRSIPNKPAGQGLVRPATQVSSPAVMSPDADACVTGTWNYTDQAGNGQAAIFWRVEVWDSDTNGNDLLATDLTRANGGYSLCFNNGDTDGEAEQDVFVVFVADNGNWRVQSPGGGTYSYASGVVPEVADGSTTDFGWLQPGDPTHMRGAAAFAATWMTWINTPGSCWDVNDVCRAVVIIWGPASTDGARYDLASNTVRLRANDPNLPMVTAHEVTHSIMDDVYEDNFPSIPNCLPHFINRASSAGCAWVEGFAEWLPVRVFNNTVFQGGPGATQDLENATFGTPNWNDGDTVEGRVAGALIDLWDNNNEGTDRVGEGMQDIWTTFQNHNSPTFAAFWTDRKNDGFDVSNDALGSLFQSTIDYGFVP